MQFARKVEREEAKPSKADCKLGESMKRKRQRLPTTGVTADETAEAVLKYAIIGLCTDTIIHEAKHGSIMGPVRWQALEDGKKTVRFDMESTTHATNQVRARSTGCHFEYIGDSTSESQRKDY